MGSWWTIAVLLLAPACLKQRKPSEDAFPAALALADAAWEARGTEGLDPAFALLNDAAALRPAHPEVRWRSARLELALGLSEDDMPARRAALARAREAGLACAFASPNAQHAWRRGDHAEAVRLIAKPDLVCQGWAALAWVRLVIDQGPAAAGVDRERLDALVNDAREEASVPQRWAQALALTLDHAPDELVIARDALLDLLREVDEPAWVRADLVLLVADPLGDAALRAGQVAAIGAARVESPEGRRARRLVAEPAR